MARTSLYSNQQNFNNLVEARLLDSAVLNNLKDFITGLLGGVKYSELPDQWQAIGDQLLKVLMNVAGDKLGIDNRGVGLASVHQGVLAAGGLPIISSTGEKLGMAYGQGAASMAIASQLEGAVNNLVRNKEGQLRFSNVGTLKYSTVAEFMAQYTRETGFKEGDIRSHRFDAGEEGIRKGIEALKQQGISEDNYDMQMVYRAMALTKQARQIEEEYDTKLRNSKAITKSGEEVTEAYINTRRKQINEELRKTTITEEEKSELTSELTELEEAYRPLTILNSIKKLESIKEEERTEEQKQELKNLKSFYEQAKYDYVYDNMKSRRLTVKDLSGNIIQEDTPITEGDMALAEQGRLGTFEAILMKDDYWKNAQTAFRAAKDNLEMLKQLFNTDDFHKLQDIAKELGMGSLVDKNNVQKIRDGLNNAAALAHMTGRDMKEVLMEQGDIRAGLSQVLGVNSKNINESLVSQVQLVYAQHNENYDKKYTNITAEERQAIQEEQAANTRNVIKYELLARTLKKQHGYIFENSEEANEMLNTAMSLYEKADNAETYEQYIQYKNEADAIVIRLRQQYASHVGEEELINGIIMEFSGDDQDRKAVRDARFNASDALDIQGKGSAIYGIIRKIREQSQNETDEQRKSKFEEVNAKTEKDVVINDVRAVSQVFGNRFSELEKFVEASKDPEKYEEYKESFAKNFKTLGYKDEEIQQIMEQLDSISIYTQNADYLKVLISLLNQNRNQGRGAYGKIEHEKNALIESIEKMTGKTSTATMGPLETFLSVISNGQEVSEDEAVMKYVAETEKFKDKVVSLNEKGHIIFNKELINQDTEDTKDLYYVDLNNLDEIKNNKKLREFLGLTDVADDAITLPVVRDAMQKAYTNGAVLIHDNYSGESGRFFIAGVQVATEAKEKVEEEQKVIKQQQRKIKEREEEFANESYTAVLPYLDTIVTAINGGTEATIKDGNNNEVASPIKQAASSFKNFKDALNGGINGTIGKFLTKYKFGDDATNRNIIQQWAAFVKIAEAHGIGVNEDLSLVDAYKQVMDLRNKGELTDEEENALTDITEAPRFFKNGRELFRLKDVSKWNPFGEDAFDILKSMAPMSLADAEAENEKYERKEAAKKEQQKKEPSETNSLENSYINIVGSLKSVAKYIGAETKVKDATTNLGAFAKALENGTIKEFFDNYAFGDENAKNDVIGQWTAFVDIARAHGVKDNTLLAQAYKTVINLAKANKLKPKELELLTNGTDGATLYENALLLQEAGELYAKGDERAALLKLLQIKKMSKKDAEKKRKKKVKINKNTVTKDQNVETTTEDQVNKTTDTDVKEQSTKNTDTTLTRISVTTDTTATDLSEYNTGTFLTGNLLDFNGAGVIDPTRKSSGLLYAEDLLDPRNISNEQSKSILDKTYDLSVNGFASHGGEEELINGMKMEFYGDDIDAKAVPDAIYNAAKLDTTNNYAASLLQTAIDNSGDLLAQNFTDNSGTITITQMPTANEFTSLQRASFNDITQSYINDDTLQLNSIVNSWDSNVVKTLHDVSSEETQSIASLVQTTNNTATTITESLGGKLDDVTAKLNDVDKQLTKLNGVYDNIVVGNALTTKLTFA